MSNRIRIESSGHGLSMEVCGKGGDVEYRTDIGKFKKKLLYTPYSKARTLACTKAFPNALTVWLRRGLLAMRWMMQLWIVWHGQWRGYVMGKLYIYEVEVATRLFHRHHTIVAAQSLSADSVYACQWRHVWM